MAKLRPVTDAPRRAIGMIRVSTERHGMISPELQRTAIEDYCARRGYTVVEWIEGIDQSGSRAKSAWWARLDEGVSHIEEGHADLIVVWKWSRTARHRLKWAVALDRVESAGGAIESATEEIDTTTATGRFTRGMMAEMAAFEAERIGDTWKESHARRTKQGLPANGKPRFGYRNVDGHFEPDPATGPVLAELYARYLAGESIFALATWLNQNQIWTVSGYSSKGPGAWSQNSLRQMLDAGFGAGYITVHAKRQPGAQKPVIDADTWNAYLAARIRRRGLKRAENSPYLLSGLVWCGCGSKMGYGTYGRVNLYPQLRCLTSTEPAAVRHPGAYIRAAPVETAVRAWVEKQARKVERNATAELAAQARSTRLKHDAKALAREVVAADKAINRLTVDRARGLVPESAYSTALAELTHDRDTAAQRHALALADAAAPAPSAIVTDLAAHWDTYALEHLRGLLRQIVERVEVQAWKPWATDWVINVVPK